jgi:uncharacterized protein YjbI with pentapeptide repeats
VPLGKKASRFHNELRRQFPDSETKSQKSGAAPEGANKEIRGKRRWLLPSNIFVQILAGPPELRHGIFGFMLRLIALTTLVAFPILLLLLLQIQFLPFHDLRITNAQRVALILDIVFLWLLRPPILADLSVESFGRARVFARVLRGFGLGLAGVVSIAAIRFAIVVATIPGEWHETAPVVTDDEGGGENTKLMSTHDLLFAGEVDPITRKRKSLFSNTLVLPGFNLYEALKIDDPKKLAWREHLLDLRGRHLEQAVLDDANLTKADLYGAQLRGAALKGAQLQGASLKQAQLQAVSLREAELQGASLDQAQLQGASLVGAKLQGASLLGAQLQGASLDFAELQGASLVGAKLQGASLYYADLLGASFDLAQLQGARLVDAALQGARLDRVGVNAADLSNVFLWRTHWGKIDPENLGAVRLDATAVRWKPRSHYSSPTGPWDAKDYAELRDSMSSIPEGKMRDEALERIEWLDCGNKSLASCDPAAEAPPEVLNWQKTLLEANVDDAAFAKALATELRELICAKDANAIYVLRGTLRKEPLRNVKRLAETGREAPSLVDFIMSKDCPVSASLTDDDKAKLLKIKQDAEKESAPPASNRE